MAISRKNKQHCLRQDNKRSPDIVLWPALFKGDSKETVYRDLYKYQLMTSLSNGDSNHMAKSIPEKACKLHNFLFDPYVALFHCISYGKYKVQFTKVIKIWYL